MSATPPAAAGRAAPASASEAPLPAGDTCSTLEAARALGLAVRSVQMMVDRGELEAWKTPGGHRRIRRDSVLRWQRQRSAGPTAEATAPRAARQAPAGLADATNSAGEAEGAAATNSAARPRVLLIEDSRHYQTLVTLLLRDRFPQLELHVADDGIAGLAMAGQLQPALLIVDILLPGIDGATLIMSLRSHPQFRASRLLVVTSLDEADRAAYRLALEGVPVVHKSRLVLDLPDRVAACLAATDSGT